MSRSRLVFALIVVGALALRCLGLVRPWDGTDWHSALGGFGTGAYARNFAEHGFAEARWMPYRWRVDLADGSVARFWYVHHPALYSVLSGAAVAALGARTWVLHLPSLAASVLSLFACRRLGRALGSERIGLVAAAAFAFLPMGVYYGILPWAEVPIAWLFVESCAAYVVWWRTGSRRALLVLLGCVLLGGLFDWPAHFLLPGLALHVLLASLRAGTPRRALVIGALFVAAVLPIALHWVHLHVVVPEAREADTENTLRWVTTLSVPLADFLGYQWSALRRMLTEPVLAVVLAGAAAQVVAVLRARDAFRAGLLLVLAVPPLAYVGAFPGRSVNHEFFWYLALPWAAFTFAWTAEGLLARLHSAAARRMALAAVVLVSCLGAWRGARMWTSKDTATFTELRERAWLRDVLEDPRNVVVTGAGYGQLLHFFAQSSLVSDVKSVAALEGLRRNVLARVDRERPVLYLFGLEYASFFPELRAWLGEHGELLVSDEPAAVGFELYDLGSWAHRAP